MGSMTFKKATKKAARLRLALGGPSGAGKTWTALAIASALGKRIAVIDTERSSASLYADQFSFDSLDLTEHSPERYVEAIRAAEREGYDVIIIDSLSHAWMGKDGALELVDKAAKRSKSGNSFAAWRDVTPLHNALVDALISSSSHIITTLRAKTEWVLDEGQGGKKTPRKVGLAWVQRDGLEYEFTIVGDIDLDHNLVISKTRWSKLAGAVISKPGAELGREMLAWLNEGDAAQPAAEQPKPADAPTTKPPLRVVDAPAAPAAPSTTPAAHAPNTEKEQERAQVRADLDALADLLGGWDRMLAAVGETERPRTLPAARALLLKVRTAQAEAVGGERQAEHGTF